MRKRERVWKQREDLVRGRERREIKKKRCQRGKRYVKGRDRERKRKKREKRYGEKRHKEGKKYPK